MMTTEVDRRQGTIKFTVNGDKSGVYTDESLKTGPNIMIGVSNNSSLIQIEIVNP